MYPDQPAGRSVLGTKETVSSFSRNNFLAYRKKHYHASNTIIAVCGPVSAAIAKEIEQAFSGIEAQKHSSKKKAVVRQKAIASRIIHKPIDQGHMAIGFHSIPYRHTDSAAVRILATILGRGQSSRLFQLLREELGAAYSVHADQDPPLRSPPPRWSMTDIAFEQVLLVQDHDMHATQLRLISKELKKLKEVFVDDVELKKAKEYSLGTLRLGLETTDDLANFYGTQLVLQKPIKEPKDLIKEYKAVTREDVRRVARKIFTGKKANIALIGPYTPKDIDISPLAGL